MREEIVFTLRSEPRDQLQKFLRLLDPSNWDRLKAIVLASSGPGEGADMSRTLNSEERKVEIKRAKLRAQYLFGSAKEGDVDAEKLISDLIEGKLV